MHKQNKGSDFLPMQTRKNSELSIILTSLIFRCELARINFCPPRSSTGKWVVLRRELGGYAVDEKSVAVGIGVGIRKIRGGLKNQPHRFGGGFWKNTWAVLYEPCQSPICRPQRGLNQWPPGLQLDGASNWATEARNMLYFYCSRKINRVKVVLLACYTPSWPDIISPQNFFSYLKQYGSNALHKILASREIST